MIPATPQVNAGRLRGRVARYLDIEGDLAWALKDTDSTDKYDAMFYFRIKGQF